MGEPIRIVIVDDHPLFRDGVVHSLNNERDLAVVGEGSNGDEAFGLATELLPDVLFLDINMPGQSGIETARLISGMCPSVRIVMLTVSEDQEDLMSALKAGARGYALKGISARDLADVARSVAKGEVHISPALAGGILFEMTYDQTTDPIDDLTEKERQILNLVGEGMTNKEIGERMSLAEKTIKHYMTNVLQKLHVRSRVEAALLAQRHLQ